MVLHRSFICNIFPLVAKEHIELQFWKSVRPPDLSTFSRAQIGPSRSHIYWFRYRSELYNLLSLQIKKSGHLKLSTSFRAKKLPE